MTPNDLAKRFMELDMDLLSYISDIKINYVRCNNHHKDWAKVENGVARLITDLENLHLEYYEEGVDV